MSRLWFFSNRRVVRLSAFSSLYLLFGGLTAGVLFAQIPAQQQPEGHFLTDSIEIGRPFRYALTYRHSPTVDVLFPDTARHFAPYQVKEVAVFTTETIGLGAGAISRDSAVYTLLSFETTATQVLEVPIRLLNETDCTALLTQPDTVFLLSKVGLPQVGPPQALTLATETTLAPLQQQFNYPVLATGLLGVGLVAAVLYGLFGRAIRRQWQLYQLNRQHRRFLRDYDRLGQRINSDTAADLANQAVITWKTYLEKLDRQPYASLTTPELAERINDSRVTSALREADQMIYGGSFSAQSQPALRVLSDVATQVYQRRRGVLRSSAGRPGSGVADATVTESSVS